MTCARCEELEERLAQHKRVLGVLRDKDGESRLQVRYGLTRQQARVLRHLAERDGRLATRDSMMLALYSDAADEPDIKVLDILICKLRPKIGRGLIYTVYGQGYGLTPDGLAACSAVMQGEPSSPQA